MLSLSDPLLHLILDLVDVALQQFNPVQQFRLLPLLHSHRHQILLSRIRLRQQSILITVESAIALFRVLTRDVVVLV